MFPLLADRIKTWFAAFHEGADRLAVVGVGGAVNEARGFIVKRGQKRHGQRIVEIVLHQLQRPGRAVGQAFRLIPGRRAQLIGGHHLINQAKARARLGVDTGGGKHQLTRFRGPHQTR